MTFSVQPSLARILAASARISAWGVGEADGRRNVLFLHAGDFSQGTSYFTVLKGDVEIEMINAFLTTAYGLTYFPSSRLEKS